jgi:hypothetical protein
VPVDGELLWSSVWLRDTVTNEPLVSGQQLAASSEEESSGSAIVPEPLSEFDLAADSRWSERCRALQQAWPFIAISDWLEFAFVDLLSGAGATLPIAMP